MINPYPVKVEDILNSSHQFTVPRYQREFAWGKSEALDFFDDLKSYSEIGSGKLFLGTIIFDISSEKKRQISLVDGQQRITTIILLLIVCRNISKKINQINLATLIQNKITFTDPTTAKSLGCRLVASESIKDVFEHISKSDWDGVFPQRIGNRQVKRQVNRIKPIYDYFMDEMKTYDQNKLSNFLKIIYETYVIRIDIQNEIEAFSIFERTNARGIDLEAADLLKNYLFSKKVEGLEEAWTQIIDNADGTVLRMFKYFYISKKGYVTKSNLYKKMQEYGNKIGAVQLVEELEEFSKFYNAIRTANKEGIKSYFESIGFTSISTDESKYEKIYYALEGLRLFKIYQIYPLIYAALNCFRNSNGSTNPKLSKKLILFFELMEKYHFINTSVCGRMGNEVEKLYATFSTNYSKSSDFDKTTKELFAELKKRLASEDDFTTRFVEIAYSATNIPLICYIFDRINNCKLDPAHRIKLYNPDPKILRKNHNIEHFYPQKPKHEDLNSKTLEMADNIGNLLVISFKTNSKLGNLNPEKKIKKIKNELLKEVQNLAYVQEFIEKYEKTASSWDKDTIEKRAEEIARNGYTNIWKID